MLTRMADMACDLVNSHMLCESVNVIMKITINFYDMPTYGTLFWVGGGGWGIILDAWGWVGKYFRWVGVGALFDNGQKNQFLLCAMISTFIQ